MNTYAQRIMMEMGAKKDSLGLRRGVPLSPEHRDEVLNRMCALFVRDAVEKSKKERRKAAINPDAELIYKRYPNRQGGAAALKAISDCIAEDGFEFVLAQTTKYADATMRWSKEDKKKHPYATTWFNERRYKLDDENAWRGADAPPPPQKKPEMLEPDGWRFAHPDSFAVQNNIQWAAIDESTKRWIIANTPQQNQKQA